MQNCPLCHQQLPESLNLKLQVQALTEHLQSEHPSGPCFQDAQKARPWRCPLCSGRGHNYAGPEGLAKHLSQKHAPAAVLQPAGAARPQAASSSPIQPAVDTTSRPVDPQPQLQSSSAEAGDTPLRVPCLPWLPRPKWLLRPPTATLLLGTWNLEHFSVGAADSAGVARKVAHICETLRALCAREGREASLVVALQEVFCPRAAAFLADHLTERDASSGGSGRVWHGATSEPLGNNADRAAFLWSGPPQGDRQQQQQRQQHAPLTANWPSSFQLLPKDFFLVVGSKPQPPQQPQPGREWQPVAPQPQPRFIRSPYYGLFRVGYANILLVNVHLAAEPAAARSEVAGLQLLAEAIQRPNCRLLRRHSLGGRLLGRRPRGMVAVLGDFNCPISRKTVAATADTGDGGAPPPPPGASPAPAAARSPVGEGRESLPQQTAGGNGNGLANGLDDGRGNGNGGGGGVNAPSWEAFLRNGWVNALCTVASVDGGGSLGTTTANGSTIGNNGNGTIPLATNWRAKQLKALDAVCVPGRHAGLVTGRGVCPPPARVDPSQPSDYPNHLLCWVRLDLGPLQRAPGKVRQLQPPARSAPAAGTARSEKAAAVEAEGNGAGRAVRAAAAARVG